MKKYTVDYFIKKLSKIPAAKWGAGSLGNGEKHCVHYFCGTRTGNQEYKRSPESRALDRLFEKYYPEFCSGYEGGITIGMRINDSAEIFGNNPKERILVALENIKGVRS